MKDRIVLELTKEMNTLEEMYKKGSHSVIPELSQDTEEMLILLEQHEDLVKVLKETVVKTLLKSMENKGAFYKRIEGRRISLTKSSRKTFKILNLEILDPKFTKMVKQLNNDAIREYKEKEGGNLPQGVEENESVFLVIKKNKNYGEE